jgi:hypothetical protein
VLPINTAGTWRLYRARSVDGAVDVLTVNLAEGAP